MKQERRFDIVLVGIAILAAFLNIFNIWNSGNANAYYTAAVTSMLQSFHNFFYASFDPAGFITVDKPPVVFWVQTAFAAVFGVHGWSVILPQALAGVGSVLLMYTLVKPTFGRTAARLSSLVMAFMPVAVAVSRTNNIDSLLVFTLLLGAWMLFRGVRSGKLGWVLGAFAMIGLGFNMKMMQAYMVVPAFFLLYVLAFKAQWKKKLIGLIAATVLMLGVSVSWAVVVDSIPAEDRPYIGSSSTNSVLELAFGYNGVSRLTGDNTVGGQSGTQQSAAAAASQQSNSSAANTNTQQTQNGTTNTQQTQNSTTNMQQDGGTPPSGGPQGGMGRNNGTSGLFGTGQAGPLRLFQKELSGQASWLLPFVAFASVALLAGIRLRQKFTDKQIETLFWLAWLLPIAAFFSIAGFFHHYYLIMLAPAIAGLSGAGWVELWSKYRDKEGWKAWLLPSSIAVTTAFQLYILQAYSSTIGIGWLIAVGIAGMGTALVLFFARSNKTLSSRMALAGMLALLIGPLYWSATPLIYGENTMLPQAGPSGGTMMGGNRPMDGNMPQDGQPSFGAASGNDSAASQDANKPSTNAMPQNGGQPPAGTDIGTAQDGARFRMGGGMGSELNEALLNYVTKNNTGETFLFGTTDANSASSYIIETGKAVMAMGGFSGEDPALTVEKLQKMVENNEIKFFYISDNGLGRGSSDVLTWIKEHSTEIPATEWQGSSSSSSQTSGMGMGGSGTLYQINK
ncbi:glycosyltransferase family 39 protein [Ectobacillus funiculus]|uniref:ArnT family glycosyltransferase n=1 Tax=Ectobacillus funiculus TaxID=137993 RepID=UPI003978C0D8